MSVVAAFALHWHWREDDLLRYPLWQLKLLQDALQEQVRAANKR